MSFEIRLVANNDFIAEGFNRISTYIYASGSSFNSLTIDDNIKALLNEVKEHDTDGTLAKRFQRDLLDEAIKWFELLSQVDYYGAIAIRLGDILNPYLENNINTGHQKYVPPRFGH